MDKTHESGPQAGRPAQEPVAPRVELQRGQHHLLERLSRRSGRPVKELVRQAVERYLQEVENLDRDLEQPAE